MTTLPDSLKKQLDQPVFVILTTLQHDGTAQSSPVWVKRDGNHLILSTTVDRQKTLNMQRDPRVTVLVHPPEAPYTYAEIRGRAEVTTEGGQELIDELAAKYSGKARYADFNPDAVNDGQRVVVKVTPERVVCNLQLSPAVRSQMG